MKQSIKKLDLMKVPAFERHAKIFGLWNALNEGETMRIINDHEPKPLYYQFEAEQKGKFEWNYEVNGPKKWVFRVKKISHDEESKKKEIKSLLKKLHSKRNDARLKEKGKKILKNISPSDLAILEQELINEGTTRKEMRKLCGVHLELMKESLEGKELNLKPRHPIHTLMGEHKLILGFVSRLQSIIRKLNSAKDFNEAAHEINLLEHIAVHLVEADLHHKREEDVLFPALAKHGITEPPQIMLEEHKELKPRKAELLKLAKKHGKILYPVFVKKISETAAYLIKELPSHIYKEDKILYPMALQAIPKSDWAEIKKKCDKIGYCCFTPKA